MVSSLCSDLLARILTFIGYIEVEGDRFHSKWSIETIYVAAHFGCCFENVGLFTCRVVDAWAHAPYIRNPHAVDWKFEFEFE